MNAGQLQRGGASRYGGSGQNGDVTAEVTPGFLVECHVGSSEGPSSHGYCSFSIIRFIESGALFLSQVSFSNCRGDGDNGCLCVLVELDYCVGAGDGVQVGGRWESFDTWGRHLKLRNGKWVALELLLGLCVAQIRTSNVCEMYTSWPLSMMVASVASAKVLVEKLGLLAPVLV